MKKKNKKKSMLKEFKEFALKGNIVDMAIGVVIFIFSFALSALVNKVTEREPLEF